MGLDMYLYRKTYVKNWDYMDKDELHQIVIKKGDKVRKDIKPERISEIVEQVGYWRKANAIHAWMVENVQEGNDDCGEYYVPEAKMKELLGIVNRVLRFSKIEEGKVVNGYRYKDGKEEPILEDGKVIANKEVAEKLLPTARGFFFGGTDYDQWYYEDLKRTKKILEDALKEGGDYYYSSSW